MATDNVEKVLSIQIGLVVSGHKIIGPAIRREYQRFKWEMKCLQCGLLSNETPKRIREGIFCVCSMGLVQATKAARLRKSVRAVRWYEKITRQRYTRESEASCRRNAWIERKLMTPWTGIAGSINSTAKGRGSNPTGIVTNEGVRCAWNNSSGRCFYCGTTLRLQKRLHNTVQWDHMVPLFRGGRNEDNNIAPACRECNTQKGTLTADEYHLVIAGLFVPMFGMLRASHVCSTRQP